jgi:gliding motility-associated-like protein
VKEKFLLSYSIFIFLLVATSLNVRAQYLVGADADPNPTSGYYTLTNSINAPFGAQLGWAWSQQPIDVNSSFQLRYNIRFSDPTGTGADGMCFIIQNQFTNSYPLTSANAGGGELGYNGFPGNSVMIEFDCFNANGEVYINDPPMPNHIAMFRNGVMNHNDNFNRLAPQSPATALSVPDLEDGQCHLVEITWDPITNTLVCSVDQDPQQTLIGSVNMANMFANTGGMVTVGFVATTGGEANTQQFRPLPNAPMVLPSMTEQICPGNVFTINASSVEPNPSNNFSWTINGSGTFVIPDLTQTGIIEVSGADASTVIQMTYNDNCGLVLIRDYLVDPTMAPNVAINDFEICPNGNWSIQPSQISGDYSSLNWDITSGQGSNDPIFTGTTFSGLGPVTIEVSPTLAGCTNPGIPLTLNITEAPAIVPSAGIDQNNPGICTNTSTTLNGTTEPNYTVTWSVAPGFSGNIVSGQNTLSPTVGSSGTYLMTVTSPLGCVASDDVEIVLLPVPEVNLGNNFQVCPNIPFDITLNNTNCPNLSLVSSTSWSDLTIGNSFTSQVAPNSNTTVSVTLSINSCSASDNVVVSAFTPPVWDLGQLPPVCGDQPFSVTSTESVLWSSSTTSATITGTIYTQNNPSPGVETVNAMLTYGNGCNIFDNIDVTIIQPYFVNLPATADFCEGSAIQIDAGNTVTWSNGDVSQTTMANEVGILTATYTDGPCVSQDQMTITMTYLPVIDFTENTTFCEGTSITLGSPGSNATQFIWSTGETTETISVSESGFYSLTASNLCQTITSDIVLDFESCEAYAFIPNTFTPDQDGLNEVWQPIIYNTAYYEVFVYNRWGDVIFHSTDPNENWLGEADKGQEYVQDGVYCYRLIVQSPEREKKEYFGYFRMLR